MDKEYGFVIAWKNKMQATELWGPFESAQDAEKFVIANYFPNSWWLMPLNKPYNSKND